MARLGGFPKASGGGLEGRRLDQQALEGRFLVDEFEKLRSWHSWVWAPVSETRCWLEITITQK